jgi:hypothetical protein
MGEQLIGNVTTVLLAIVGIAFIAVLVSRNAATSNVIRSAGNAFSGGLLAAEAPVLGGSLNAAGTYSSAGYQF